MDIFKETTEGFELAINNISKSSLKSIADNIVETAKNGNSDPLQEYIKAKGIAELASAITDGLKDLAISEAEKYGNNDKVMGCGIQVKSLPYQYDFSDNEEWLLLQANLDSVKKRIKEIETMMIDAMKYAEVIHPETGEVIPPAKIKSGGGQTVSITIPK